MIDSMIKNTLTLYIQFIETDLHVTIWIPIYMIYAPQVVKQFIWHCNK